MTDKPTSKKNRAPGRPISEQKSRDIEQAALIEFGSAGYNQASMDAIALRAGVSKRTLYLRFPNKDALFALVIEGFLQYIARETLITYRRTVPLKRQLKEFAMLHAQVLESQNNKRLLGTILYEHIHRPQLVGPIVEQYQHQEYGFIAWLESAVQDGKLQVDSTERAGHFFMSMLRGTLVWPLIFGKGDIRDLDASLDEAVDMFLGYYSRAEIGD
ncbi:TetR/AcrR family transcriptional regulator [Pseudomonas extremaustralis]|uniref:TetR/AcrR family transcriptional regulator n=1 Tax=Pseudomonas extremaustralis TaxID=359110 RepID=UPI0028581FCC|nr:TetR/AcrR family transcriptional regulator [Pseudomonas extremaustralis]MDR6575871.1 AcrR family transcriptional regulator [Pseudomonas extremaustralis]